MTLTACRVGTRAIATSGERLPGRRRTSERRVLVGPGCRGYRHVIRLRDFVRLVGGRDWETMSAEYVPTTEEIRNRILLGADMNDLSEEEREELAEFDRWLAALIREAKAEALTDLASKIEATSKRTDNTFTEHAVVEAGGLELLREAAEAYRQEMGEQ